MFLVGNYCWERNEWLQFKRQVSHVFRLFSRTLGQNVIIFLKNFLPMSNWILLSYCFKRIDCFRLEQKLVENCCKDANLTNCKFNQESSKKCLEAVRHWTKQYRSICLRMCVKNRWRNESNFRCKRRPPSSENSTFTTCMPTASTDLSTSGENIKCRLLPSCLVAALSSKNKHL